MKTIIAIACILFLFSCSTAKEDVVQSDITTKYDMSLTGFSKVAVTGLVTELSKLPFYVKHNILDLKDNTATITYTTKGDSSNSGRITTDIEDYFSKQGTPAEVNYASGMFKINSKR